jgi:hypothetical protein
LWPDRNFLGRTNVKEVGYQVDWPRARAILLAAFAVVNLILAYSIWGPSSISGDVVTPQTQSTTHLRTLLMDRGLILPSTVTVPRTPPPMRLLHVESLPTPELQQWNAAIFGEAIRGRGLGQLEYLNPVKDPETNAIVVWANAVGPAAREVRLDHREQVIDAAESYLRQVALLPRDARFGGLYPKKDQGTVAVEFVPFYDDVPVYSGYVRVEVSPRGIESVTRLWVMPRSYTEAPPKAVRPAGEALLRLAGRLSGLTPRTIVDIQLGYYAGRTLATAGSGDVQGWDTVPVWRFILDSGEVYYINAFNGEWES